MDNIDVQVSSKETDGDSTTEFADDGEGEAAFVVASRQMMQIRNLVEQVAATDVTVLLWGESGVGKEIIARHIHSRSPRAHRPFLKVNCAALPAELLESELFGYEAGAFTGAHKAKPGKFEICNKGTIFLDEIGELPVALQAKLLQVLEDRQFSRLGGRCLVSVDVRIIAATNLNIKEALAAKQFREDLYFRLETFTVQIPPLRERREEIPELLAYFMRLYSTKMNRPQKEFSRGTVDYCMQYSWPGNVRELANFVRRLLIFEEASMACQIPGALGGQEDGKRQKESEGAVEITQLFLQSMDLKSKVKELKARTEKEAINLALKLAKGARTPAARLLNISTKTLLQKMRRYGLEQDGFDPSVPEGRADIGTGVPSRE